MKKFFLGLVVCLCVSMASLCFAAGKMIEAYGETGEKYCESTEFVYDASQHAFVSVGEGVTQDGDFWQMPASDGKLKTPLGWVSCSNGRVILTAGDNGREYILPPDRKNRNFVTISYKTLKAVVGKK